MRSNTLPRAIALSRTAGRAPLDRLTQTACCSKLLRRQYSSAAPDLAAELPALDASKLEITKTTTPKPLLPSNELVFGRNFTDHMLTAEWTASKGWLTPRITPYQNFSLDPATSVLHYAFTAFEGTKAYRAKDGSVRLFRPDMNFARMNRSAARIALPTFDINAAIELLRKYIAVDERFIPHEKGYSLYIRPTIIGTQRTLGVGPPGSALWYIIASPVGPYYASGFKAVNLEATTYATRAWPGGVGNAKLGANYAPCVLPQVQAASRGYHQNLWIFGEDEKITEVGTMNLFIAMEKPEGGKELVTAPLDGMILAGITRDSVLALARERMESKGWTVSERYVTMPELAKAADEGRLLEVFGSGTAAMVSPVRKIRYNERELDCGLKEHEEIGEVANNMKNWIEEIQSGEIEHPWSVKV